ncbi:Gmad2 immunoglobulin-like domain-containing protein [Robertmurraya massiliosenegalensis]|uniref:Gmad2 immunoglobulin-like domain-containing protein n=1 Tax=Robertmurraya TaxID=2837507 RepID=UPI0039A4BE67
MLKQLAYLFFIPFLVNLVSGEVQQEAEKRIFENVQVEGKAGNYKVKGEASTKEGKLFYTVEDGHYQYIDETVLSLSKKYPDMASFAINIKLPPEKLSKNATLMLHLYEKDEKGRIIHSYPVVLEQK